MMNEPHELSPEECARLLRSGVVGRVAIIGPDGPHIVPVNYGVVHDRIVFRTTPYSVLGAHGRSAQMAFEIDHVDYEYGTGWSVVARGRGDVIQDPREFAEVTTAWAPRPWAGGVRNVYFALRWDQLTGRRLGAQISPRRDLDVDQQLRA